MTILETIGNQAFSLPKSYNKGTFIDFLDITYQDFFKALDTVTEGTIVKKIADNRSNLEELCRIIIRSLKLYNQGHPAKAYFEFETGMKIIDEFLFPQTNISVNRERIPLFRARNGSNIQYNRNEMFHIPFQLRNHVTTQRFSIPGLPCLYLSNSSYVCWEELRRPDISKMQVSRYNLTNHHLKFLDLSLTPHFLIRMLELTTKGDFLEHIKEDHQTAIDGWDILTLSYIMKWPLIAACSIKVRENAQFKPEYIFPQFLLQWVTHNKQIDGIKYFSVEANAARPSHYSNFINYALPIKEDAATGYCKRLQDSFTLTESISWELLTIAHPQIIEHNKEKQKKHIDTYGTDITILEIIEGKEVFYWHTIFGKMEAELAEMQLDRISS